MQLTDEITDPGVTAYRLGDHTRTLDDHETRLRRLERWAWIVFGAAGGGGLLGSWIGKLIGG